MTLGLLSAVRSHRSIVLALVLVGCACSPAPAPDDGSVEDAQTDRDAGLAPDATVAPLDATVADAAVAPLDAALPLLQRYGDVTLQQYAERQGDWSSKSGAEFFDLSEEIPLEAVDTEIDGCSIRVEISPADVGHADANADAGRIEIASASATDALEVDSATHWYPGIRFADPRWTPGDALAIHAAGGDVPAFDATLAFPRAIAFEIPATPALTEYVPVPHDADYAVRWTPAPDGLAYVSFIQVTSVGDRTRWMRVLCPFPASAGEGTIARRVMNALIPSDAVHSTTFVNAGGVARSDVNVEGWTIRALAYHTTVAWAATVR